MNAKDKYLKNCDDANDIYKNVWDESRALSKASWMNDITTFDVAHKLYEFTRDTAYEAYNVACAEYLREFEIARNIERDVYELEASNLTNQKELRKWIG